MQSGVDYTKGTEHLVDGTHYVLATDEEFEAIQKFIEENYEVDIDAEDGKQPVYSFIIGVE